MARRIGRGLALLALFVAALPREAEAEPVVRYEATVDRQVVGIDETLTLTVVVSMTGGGAAEIELPPTPDFQIRSRSSSEQSSFHFGSGGSGRQKIRTFTLVLQPLREGELTIGPGTATVKGKQVRSDPIVVQVRGRGQGAGPGALPGPQHPALAGRRGGEDVFVQVTVDKEEAYVGAPVVLRIYLYSRVDISNVSSLQLPELDGFWIGDIASPTQLQARMQTIGGVPYRVYLLNEKALFPLREGVQEISPATVDVTVGSFPFGRSRSVRRSSDPLEVVVHPLPEGAPAGLQVGGVGSWRLEASAEPKEVEVGEPITFRLVASGVGNPARIQLPSLDRIEGLRAYEPTTTESVKVSSGSYGGSKTMEVLLVPEAEGRYTLPALTWLHFDPKEERYIVTETEPLHVSVRGGRKLAGDRGAPRQGDDLSPIRERIRVTPHEPLVERGWFVWALALPALLALGATLLPRLQARREGGEGARRFRGAGRDALDRLRSLRKADAGQQVEGIPRILHGYLEAKLGRPTAGLPRRELEVVLEEAGAGSDRTAALTELLDTCDQARFASGQVQGSGDGLVPVAEELVRGLEADELGGAR